MPDRGDLIWIALDPQQGHEQAGRRPALVLSPRTYNRATSLALLCPVTSRAKGYPFEAALPPGLKTAGVVLSDQIKSLDWRARDASFVERAPSEVVLEVRAKLQTLIG